MTITTTHTEHETIAIRYEAEERWAQAAAAWQGAIDAYPKQAGILAQPELNRFAERMNRCITKSHTTTEVMRVPASEEAKAIADRDPGASVVEPPPHPGPGKVEAPTGAV